MNEISRDGCVYVTEEEQKEFERRTAPTTFDPERVKNKFLDVPFGTLPEQKLDIYLPESAEKPWPVIFEVHGGGWIYGSKRECFLDGIIGALQHGYAVISVDYRLAPQVMYPENLYDVKTAIRWARAHAEKYGFDPAHFGMIGDSAGGHLTLMAGMTAGHPELAGAQYGWADFSDELQVICDMFGPSVLDDFQDSFFRESGVRRVRFGDGSIDMIRTVFGSDKNLLRLISPISYVHKNMSPALILQGRMDGVVPYQHSALLYEKIVRVCGEGKAKLIMYEDRIHEDNAFYRDDDLLHTVIPFFDRYLK